MNPLTELWRAYTLQTLSWRLGTSAEALPTPAKYNKPHGVEAVCARLAHIHATSGRTNCILLGAGDGTLAHRLRTALPAEHILLVLEGDMACARAACARLPDTVMVLADTSPMALFLLTCGVLSPDTSTLAWTLPVQERERTPGTAVLTSWRRLFVNAKHETIPAAAPLRLVVGGILHPDEPHLETFFAHIPHWIQALAIVWDGHAPPNLPVCAVPVHSMVRPLDGDFSAQRNVMLDMCRTLGDWCLYLDADERLPQETWETLPRLAACANAGGVAFPRITFEGDAHHARMGYGLWPDIQLRFFALGQNSPHFVGRVHETLHNLAGDTLLAPGLHIHHYSHIHKDRATLHARLAVFNTAAGTPTHILSHEYPRLPLDLLLQATADFGTQKVVLLP